MRAILLVKRHNLIITIGAFFALAVTLIANAWVVDDAYITFRTVDNFVHGYGLTWNTSERVQSYTHPLWMLLASLFYLVTSDVFFTVILLSFCLTIASVSIALAAATSNAQDTWWKCLLLILSLISSKAFIDYASSGLENPMSYLIASLFLITFIPLRHDRQVDEKKAATLLFLSSIAFLNRYDTIILYFPALMWLLYLSRSMPKWRLARVVFVSTLPASLWLCFSLVYYGYPYPNTAYAKAISTGFPLSWKIQRGLEYQANSIYWDTASYVILAGAVWFALKNRSPTSIAIIAGLALYMLFVMTSGASATHMSGRFYAVPLFIAIILFVSGVTNHRLALIACSLLAVYITWSPVSAIKFGTAAYQPFPQNESYIDTKWYVLNEGAALLNWRPGKKMPDNTWYEWGDALRRQPESVYVGGAFGGEAIGYAGFAAGPEKHFIDRVGLSDPLLARLPANMPARMSDWKSGHFHRTIPAGYVESLASGKNLLLEPNLKKYYDIVRTITRDPIFSWERFSLILNMNLGCYEYLLKEAEPDREKPQLPHHRK